MTTEGSDILKRKKKDIQLGAQVVNSVILPGYWALFIFCVAQCMSQLPAHGRYTINNLEFLLLGFLD